jgi:PAS domain S-box-containing protein
MHKQHKIHILIVEDNPGDVRITQIMLRDDPLGEYTFTTCDTLQAAAQFLAEGVADIALLDLNLPDSSGIATYSALQLKAPDLPVVIMSGNNDLDAATEAVRAGAQDYIVKGTVDSAALSRVIRYAIERKQVFAKLKESESKYRQIVETAREGMWIIKSDDSVEFVNQELANILGYKKEEIVGSNSLNFVLQQDRDELKQKIRNRRSGIKETYEFRILRSDGKPLSVLISSTPRFDDEGNYIGALAMITDITHRKEAEQAILLERNRAQKYFDIAGVILLVQDREGKIEKINQKGADILGYENPDKLIGLDWFDHFIPADLRNEARKAHVNLMNSTVDTTNNIESRILTRSSEQRHIAWHHTTIRDPHGPGNIATLSSGEDISERVALEQQREMLLDLSREAASQTDFEKLLFFITEKLVDIIEPVDSASIFLIDYQRKVSTIKAWAGFGEEDLQTFEVPLNDSATNRIITTKEPQHIKDIIKDPDYVDIENDRLAVILSSIAAPVINRDNQVIGIIFCDSRERANAFNDDDLAFLDAISKQLAGLIENIRLLNQTQAQHAALQTSQAQYRDLFNAIFNGFALHEMIFDDGGKPIDYRFLEVNPAFCQMTGLKEEDIIGKTVLEVLPQTEPYWIEAYAKVVRTGKPLRIEQYSVSFNKHFDVIAFSPARGQFATIFSDITEQHNLIDALKQERDRAQDYLDIAEVMIVALDEKGVITLANRKSCDILGYREGELVGRNWFDLCVPAHDRERAWSLFSDFLSSGETTGPNYEQVFLTKMGEERTARWQSRKLVDQNDTVRGSLSSGEDITEQKITHEALRQYERIVSSSSDMMALVTIDQDYLAANDVYCKVFGLTRDEIIGKNARELFDREFFDNVMRPYIDRCLVGEEVIFNEWITLPNKERRYMETRYYPYSDAKDNVVGMVVNRRDITEQHKVQQALQDSENRRRNIINNSTNMFYSHTPDHILTFVSPQSEAILGYKPQEMMVNWMDLATDNPVNKEGVLRTEKAIATGEVQPSYELELRTKSGRHVWVEVHEAPVLENGKVTSIVGSLTDITTRRRAELESQQSLAALKIANEDLHAVHQRLLGTMDATIRTIAKTVEVRDPYTAGHHRRVSELSVRIAREMELEEEMIKAIELAAVIHDLGKIQVPAEILSKPGRLSEIEFGLVKIHPTVGYKLLKDIDFPWPLAEIIHQHHERMDGTGYPRGLKGDQITLESRIICVADTVEAMSSHRPYRPALGIDRALEQIKLDRGTHYDPQVVDACLRVFAGSYQMPAN